MLKKKKINYLRLSRCYKDNTRTSAIALQYKVYRKFRTAIDSDIKRVKDFLADLQEYLTSLSEVVLQNRRRLDLIFLKQGTCVLH